MDPFVSLCYSCRHRRHRTSEQENGRRSRHQCSRRRQRGCKQGNGCRCWGAVLGQITEAPLSALPPPPTHEQARRPAGCAKARSLVPPSLTSRERARERPLIKEPFSAPPLSCKQAREWSLMPGHRMCSKNRNSIVLAAAAAANTQPSKGAGCLCQGYVTHATTAAITQVSKRTAVDQGTGVCSAAATVTESKQGNGCRCRGTVLGLGR